MSEQCWLDNSNITFPLIAATKLLSGDDDAEPDFAFVERVFAGESIFDLELVEDGRTVSLAAARSHCEWAGERSVKEIFQTLAPICPDGTYAELESTYADSDSRKYRLVVAGDSVVEDFPTISWDPPEQVALNAIARIQAVTE